MLIHFRGNQNHISKEWVVLELEIVTGKTKDVRSTKNQQLNLFVVPIDVGGKVIVKMLGIGQMGKIKQEFVIEQVVVSITWI